MKTGIVISVSNSTTVALGAAQTFTGVAEDIRAFPETTINLYGEPSVAPGTLYFEYSPDGINWDVSVPYTLDGPQSFVPLPLRTVLPYFRVRYVNGATPLTVLRLTTVFHWEAAKQITRVINQVVDENEPVENVRAFIGGKSPDGPYQNLPAAGVVSDQSTTVTLLAGAQFNTAGPITPITGFVAVGVTVISDQSSASGGVDIQFFKDSAGTIIVKEAMFTYGSPGTGANFSVPTTGSYFRVKYTNGAVNQASFTLITNLFVTAPPPDVLSVADTVTGNNASQIVKAILAGQKENGDYANSRLSNSGSQLVAITDRPSEVRNRTRVEIVDARRSLVVSPGTIIYTVTVGKALYISSIVITAINDANAIGEFYVADGLTPRMPFVLANKATGAPASYSAPSPFLPEPIKFLTDVRLIEVTGDVITGVTLIGYEEPL